MKSLTLRAVAGALVLALMGVACGPKSLPRLPEEVPAVVDQTDATVRAAVVAGLDVLDSVGDVVNDLSRIRAELQEDGIGAPEWHAAVSARLVTIAQLGLDGIERLKGGVETWAEIKAVIDPLLVEANRLLDLIEHAATTVRSRLEDVWVLLYHLLSELIGVGSGEPIAARLVAQPKGA